MVFTVMMMNVLIVLDNKTKLKRKVSQKDGR